MSEIVTASAAFLARPEDPGRKALPSILEAIAKAGPDGEPREERVRAAATRKVAEGWFREHRPWAIEAERCRKVVNGDARSLWNDRTESWITAPETMDDRPYAAVNIVGPRVQQMVAELTKDTPQLKVTAGTTEIADAAASEYASKVAGFIQRHSAMDEVFRASADEVSRVGESWLLPQWRGDRGPRGKVGARLTKEPQFDAAGAVVAGPEFEDVLGLQGDVEFRIIPGEMVATEPGSKARHGADGVAICVRESVNPAELRARFPKKWEAVKAAGAESIDSDEASLNRADRASPFGGTPPTVTDGESNDKPTTLYTFWVRAVEGYPRGAMICVAGDTVCEEGDNDQYQAEGEPEDLAPRIPFPLIQAVADTHRTTSRGRSRVLDVIAPQLDYNDNNTRRNEHYDLLAVGRLLAPVALTREFTNRIGEVIRYSHRQMGADAIRYLMPPPMPDYQQGMADAVSRVDEGLGINGPTQGIVPFANTSGRAMDKAQQKDETRLGPIKRSLFNQAAEGMLRALRLYRRHATYPRKIMTAGENQTTNLAYFEGAKLASCLDAVVFNDQMLPVDPTARHLALSTIFQTMAGIPDEKVRKEYARLARLQNDEAFLDEQDPHRVKADRNSRKIMLGEPVEYAAWDDHLTHKAVLELLMCSEEWELRVAAEKADEQNMTVGPMGEPVPGSPTEYATLALWQQHAQELQVPAAMPGMQGAGAGAEPPDAGPQAEMRSAA